MAPPPPPAAQYYDDLPTEWRPPATIVMHQLRENFPYFTMIISVTFYAPGSSSAAHLRYCTQPFNQRYRNHESTSHRDHRSASIIIITVITIDWLPRMLASPLLLFGSCSGISRGPALSLSSLMAHGWNAATYGCRLLLTQQPTPWTPSNTPSWSFASVWEFSRLNL